MNAWGSGAPAPVPPGQRGRVVDRAFDLVVASMALVAVAPACLLIAMVVKLDSKGPVFVTQSHSGRNGRRCSIARFRTTHTAGRPHLIALPAHDMAASATCSDPRPTRVGPFLRRFCLDELPKLWSVLLGDTSLVRPRPLPTDKIAVPTSPPRLRERPAVTSIWQNGRGGPPAFPGKVWQHTRTEQ